MHFQWRRDFNRRFLRLEEMRVTLAWLVGNAQLPLPVDIGQGPRALCSKFSSS
jgi:hypothetical protein